MKRILFVVFLIKCFINICYRRLTQFLHAHNINILFPIQKEMFKRLARGVGCKIEVKPMPDKIFEIIFSDNILDFTFYLRASAKDHSVQINKVTHSDRKIVRTPRSLFTDYELDLLEAIIMLWVEEITKRDAILNNPEYTEDYKQSQVASLYDEFTAKRTNVVMNGITGLQVQ